MWMKYLDLEPIRRLHFGGRELLGNRIYITVKRDGENLPLYLNDNGDPTIGSRKRPVASPDIQSRMLATPEYGRAVELIISELNDYNKQYILYGELLKKTSPTRIEPKRKHLHWIMFAIYDVLNERYLGYNYVYQKGYQFKIPVVKLLDEFVPMSGDELHETIAKHLKWCKRHRREGIVGGDYKNQVFFKARIDLPKQTKIKKERTGQPELPIMPEEKIIRALQHAFDEIGEENWTNVKIAMPIVARHIATEAREHYYAPPKSFYKYWVTTPIEIIRGDREGEKDE